MEEAGANFLTQVGTFFTNALDWAGDIANFIVKTEPYNYFLGIALIGATIGIIRAVRH